MSYLKFVYLLFLIERSLVKKQFWQDPSGLFVTLYRMTKIRLDQIESICRRQNEFKLKIKTCVEKGRKH